MGTRFLVVAVLLGGCIVERDYVVTDGALAAAYETQRPSRLIVVERYDARGTFVFVAASAIRDGEPLARDVVGGRVVVRTRRISTGLIVAAPLAALGSLFTAIAVPMYVQGVEQSDPNFQGHCDGDFCGIGKAIAIGFMVPAALLLGGALAAEIVGWRAHPAEAERSTAPRALTNAPGPEPGVAH